MKKTFNYYTVCWLISLIIFNAVAFITPNELAGFSKLDGAFWVGYVFISLAFLGQLVCAYITFKAENLNRLFYNLSLISISYIGLITMLIIGALCMALPFVPTWLGVILCLLVLGVSAISLLKSVVAIDVVKNIDDRVKEKTQFIKLLIADAEHLKATVSNDELKAEVNSVYEAIRYSDPMSNGALSEIENKIQSEFEFFEQAVKSDDLALSQSVSKELIDIIDKRNKKCKALK